MSISPMEPQPTDVQGDLGLDLPEFTFSSNTNVSSFTPLVLNVSPGYEEAMFIDGELPEEGDELTMGVFKVEIQNGDHVTSCRYKVKRSWRNKLRRLLPWKQNNSR